MLIENIKAFFSKKAKNEETEKAPEAICPNCWGETEWEGEFYTIIKDPHTKPGNAIYDNFIKKVADKYENTSHKHEDKYICDTCNLKY